MALLLESKQIIMCPESGPLRWNKARVWNARDGKCRLKLEGHTDEVSPTDHETMQEHCAAVRALVRLGSLCCLFYRRRARRYL